MTTFNLKFTFFRAHLLSNKKECELIIRSGHTLRLLSVKIALDRVNKLEGLVVNYVGRPGLTANEMHAPHA